MSTIRPDTTDKPAVGLAAEPRHELRRILIIDPDAHRRRQVALGLVALGYHPEAFGTVDEVPWLSPRPWVLVLTGAGLAEHELAQLHRHLNALADMRPPTRSLASIYCEEDDENRDQVDASEPARQVNGGSQAWSEDFRISLLQWAADEGPAVLRPVPCLDASLGHSYPQLERHFNMGPGDAIRVLEDLADLGVLARTLSNRVHLCPDCRRWPINFRETCPSCAGLDVAIEGMIHHFACAYVGLDSEYRRGTDLQCPKCKKRLTHIGLDYERPRQTYVCHTCAQLFEEPTVTAQCLDCRWEGASCDVLAWSVYEYELTARGHEAIERGELRGIKLREMIRSSRYALASREFFELELEREVYRLNRYGRPVSVLICRFLAEDRSYAVFHETDQETLQAFAKLIAGVVRSLDVAALADAATIALLLPETNESQAKAALARLRQPIDGFQIETASGHAIDRRWVTRSWNHGPAHSDEALLWFQQQLESQPTEA